MYERLRVYINVEQNSTTNNSGKENFLYFVECVYMYGDTLHVYFSVVVMFLFLSHQKN